KCFRHKEYDMAEGLLERDPMECLHELYNDSYGNGSYNEMSYGDVIEDTQMSEDAEHNAHINEKYRKLVNPDEFTKYFQDTADVYQEEPPYVEETSGAEDNGEFYYVPEEKKDPVLEEFPLVRDARASSFLFHAESPVNEQFMNDSIIKTPLGSNLSGDIREETAVGMEEEGEDLRPSATTIQYIDGVHSEDAVQEKARKGFFASLTESKKRRLMLGGLCAVLFALVVVVIVNCAVISHLSKSLEAAQAEDQTIEAVGQAYGAEEAVYEIYE
ncbi:MAG: hypothetical protein LUD72_12725, partial [Bacteroidales bacterium]|nr:hypothetical protein [Bacteroidales bacterium]